MTEYPHRDLEKEVRMDKEQFRSRFGAIVVAASMLAALVACDDETATAPPATEKTSKAFCNGYACHWVGVKLGETTTDLSGARLVVYDTIHLNLLADSTHSRWMIETAWKGTEQVGLKPGSTRTGTWRVRDSLLVLTEGENDVELTHTLIGGVLTLKLSTGAMTLLPQ